MTKKDLYDATNSFLKECDQFLSASFCDEDEFDPCWMIGRLHSLAEDCLRKADEIEARTKELELDAKLWAKVRDAKNCFDINRQDDESLGEVVSDLKTVVDVMTKKTLESYVSASALFVALRQPTDVELEYELAHAGRCFYFTRRGLEKHELKWECDFGASEGIYLVLYLVGEENKTPNKFATIKTLKEDDDSFRKMCALGAEYALAFRKFPSL